MDKDEILRWNQKYDKENPWWNEKENELGDKFRKTKTLTKTDLRQCVEWKFNKLVGRKKRVLKFIENNDDEVIRKVGTQVFNLTPRDDIIRIRQLDALQGVGPAMASVILTFYDPKNYGVHDIHVWREFFGPEPSHIFTGTSCYLKLLAELRRIANRFNLPVRTVEKAYFLKNYENGS